VLAASFCTAFPRSAEAAHLLARLTWPLGGGHDQREFANPARVLQGDGLRNEPAHRCSDEMDVVQPKTVKKAHGIGGHVTDGVRQMAPQNSSGQAIICMARPMTRTTGGWSGSPNVS